MCNIYIDSKAVQKVRKPCSISADKLTFSAGTPKKPEKALRQVTSPLMTAATAAPVPSTKEVPDEAIISFLNKLLQGPTKPGKQAATAGAVLHRRLMVVRALQKLDDLDWGSPKGFLIPDGVYSCEGSVLI